MARYTGADCKLCRREKIKLFLKGAKCDSPKCPIEIRPYPPGEHGRNRTKDSEYLLQIREKQKARRIYGVLEKQFRGYYEEAARKRGKTGENLLQILESRLDNVVYRAGFAKSRDMARQLVRHGHFMVNGKRVDIPSYRVSENDIIEVRAEVARADPDGRGPRRGRRAARPAWLEVIPDQMRILVHQLPAGRRSTPRSRSSSSSSTTPSNAQHRLRGPGQARLAGRAAARSRRHIAGVAERKYHAHRTASLARPKSRSTTTGRGSSSSRWSQASATRSGTRSAAPCCPPSPARRSPGSGSRACCTSSPPCPGSRKTSPTSS